MPNFMLVSPNARFFTNLPSYITFRWGKEKYLWAYSFICMDVLIEPQERALNSGSKTMSVRLSICRIRQNNGDHCLI